MRGSEEVVDFGIGLDRSVAGGIRGVNQQGGAARLPAGLDVPPAVPHHERIPKGKFQLLGGLFQQAGLGLSAGTTVGIVVIAGVDVGEPQLPTQPIMERLDSLPGDEAPLDLRLIGHHDQLQPGLAQEPDRLWDAGKDLELRHGAGGAEFPSLIENPQEDAVPIQKNRPT